MSYSFKIKDRPVGDGVRRIAHSQIDKAIAEIDDDDLKISDKVHQLRKRAKKIRGLIRLVRPVFDGYKDENAIMRDAARSLAPIRDSIVMIETLDELVAHYQDELDQSAFLPVRDVFLEVVRNRTIDGQAKELLAEYRQTLRELRDRVDDWQVEEDGFDAIEGGLRKTYGRAIQSLDVVIANPDDKDIDTLMHAFRKRVKYHWYHARLLRRIWPAMINTRKDLADDLADRLGWHHDLSVFGERLNALDFGDAAEEPRDVLGALLKERQAIARQDAATLGKRLFAEKPRALARRWRTYWKIWHKSA